jgi:hypothetical protein
MSEPDLTGNQKERLHRALLSAYDLPRITQLVAFKFQPPTELPVPVPPVGPFANIGTGDFPSRVLDLIGKAEQEGWTDALVREAHRFVPGNERLRNFYAEYFTSIQRQAPGASLQRLIEDTDSFLQPAMWRDKLAALEATVCCIELGGMPNGSGFLVAEDIVLTNHHVLELLIGGTMPADQIGFRFDFKRLGKDVLNSGVVRKLAADWKLAVSPPSDADDVVDPASLNTPGAPKKPEAGENELDYALVRLEPDPDANPERPRGFVPPPAPAAYEFKPRSTLHILQHPAGRPLELALGQKSLVRRNDGRTRVTYRTSTLGGSSGSPCFDKDWNLVALHHSGDPDFQRSAEYNEGIPIHTIRQHLSADVRTAVGWSGA